MEEMITIPKQEYQKLKLLAEASKVDFDLMNQLLEGLNDIKAGRIRRVK